MTAVVYRWCYVMRKYDEEIGCDLFKIGISNDPFRRGEQLEAEVIHREPGGRQRERELHAEFSHLRLKSPLFGDGYTEWFEDITGEIAEYVKLSSPEYATA